MAARHVGLVRWELNRIERALKHLQIPILLLKGAAYVAAGLPAARGRLVSDIDIMVPRQALDGAEAALQAAGWRPIKLDPYDQRYYRTWMHELPPLVHSERGTVVDLHHTILPPTSRLKPDPAKLWSAAQPLGTGPLHVLAPPDMVLHSAAHLFHDGDLRFSLRDLVDIADLLATVWEERARLLASPDLAGGGTQPWAPAVLCAPLLPRPAPRRRPRQRFERGGKGCVHRSRSSRPWTGWCRERSCLARSTAPRIAAPPCCSTSAHTGYACRRGCSRDI